MSTFPPTSAPAWTAARPPHLRPPRPPHPPRRHDGTVAIALRIRSPQRRRNRPMPPHPPARRTRSPLPPAALAALALVACLAGASEPAKDGAKNEAGGKDDEKWAALF